MICETILQHLLRYQTSAVGFQFPKRAAGHLAPLGVASLAAHKERATSESRFTPPSRLSVLCGVYALFFGVLLGSVKRHSHMKFVQEFFENVLLKFFLV